MRIPVRGRSKNCGVLEVGLLVQGEPGLEWNWPLQLPGKSEAKGMWHGAPATLVTGCHEDPMRSGFQSRGYNKCPPNASSVPASAALVDSFNSTPRLLGNNKQFCRLSSSHSLSFLFLSLHVLQKYEYCSLVAGGGAVFHKKQARSALGVMVQIQQING